MTDTSTIRAGLFVLIALAILVVGSLWVAGFYRAGDKSTYEVLMKSSAGVRRGDPVRVAGMEVGRVRAVELRPGEEWPVVFRVALDGEIPVSEAASARLTADGLLGTPYLEIDPGPTDAPPLQPDSPIIGIGAASASEAMSGLNELSDRAAVALEEVTVLLQSLSGRVGPLLHRVEVLLADENLAAITDSLTAMRDTLQQTGPRVSALLDRLDEVTADLSSGIEEIPKLSAAMQDLVADLRTALGPDGERVAAVLESADASLTAVEMNRGELEAMLRDLRAASANLKAFTEAVKERPSLLVRKSRAPDRKPGEGTQP
jgi:phospholipid/cholesterol/gamma-HCH transport system substrate-binding protein